MTTNIERTNLIHGQKAQQRWVDVLPVCKQTGVGFSTNQIYKEDGYCQKEHLFEDRSFHCQYGNSTFLYAIFDGYKDTRAATFAMQKMTAEILLGQLNSKTTEEEIKEVLRQIFVAIKSGYKDSVGDSLAGKTSLQIDIPDGLNSNQAYTQFPHVRNKSNTLNYDLSTRTSAIVILIYAGKLYVANIGSNRALLCKTDSNQDLSVVQLNVEHDLSNENELLHLHKLQLDIQSIKQGNEENTQCFDNYLIKEDYKEFEELSSATAKPIIAEPEIYGGIELNESCRFLLLMSQGLYKSLEEATGTKEVNKELALMTIEQFKTQSTLTEVAQAVVDKIVQIHYDMNMSNSQHYLTKKKRDDITLFVRNFNFPLPNAHRSFPEVSIQFNQQPMNTDNKYILKNNDDSSIWKNINFASDESPSEMYDSSDLSEMRNSRIDPYVDFSEYYINLEKRKKEGSLPNEIDFSM